MLVPSVSPERSITSGTTESFRFRVKTRGIATQRIWAVCLRVDATTGVTAEIEAPALTGTTATVLVPNTLARRVPFVYTETLSARSSAVAEVSLSIKAVGGTVIVESIACYEQDRPTPNLDGTDYGCDTSTIRGGQPMIEVDNESIGGVYHLVQNADARRVGIYHWTYGDGEWSRSTASPQTLLQLACPVLAKKIARGDVTGSVKWSAYAKVDAGAGATLRLTTDGTGLNDAMTITGTSFAWQTPRTVSIDCDDMTGTDGRQTTASPRWDGINFTLTGDGTNTCRIKSISVWDEA